jgi:hypothetical protein
MGAFFINFFMQRLLKGSLAVQPRVGWPWVEMADGGNPPQGEAHGGGQMRECPTTTKKHNVKCKDKLSRSPSMVGRSG